MKRLIIAFISLLLMAGVAHSTPVDCSGLPKNHNVDIGIRTTAGGVVVAPQDTVEVTDDLLLDSAYTYDFTAEVAGTTYIVQCFDITDSTNNFTFTLSGRETFVNAAVGLVALEATLTAIKGAGWTTETLVAIQAAIESGGLSAQQVRDAMKLAPTVGDPATGSVDKHLDDIKTKVRHQ